MLYDQAFKGPYQAQVFKRALSNCLRALSALPAQSSLSVLQSSFSDGAIRGYQRALAGYNTLRDWQSSLIILSNDATRHRLEAVKRAL